MGFFNLNKNAGSSSSPSGGQTVAPEAALQSSLDENLRGLKATLGQSSDVICREFMIGNDQPVKAGLLYTDGLTDTAALQDFILESLMLDLPAKDEPQSTDSLVTALKDSALTVGEVKEVTSVAVLLKGLLSGETILLVDGSAVGLMISNKKWVERGVTEPNSQTVVRGPRESFSENIRVNTALIRRRVKDPNLWIEPKTIGVRSKTSVELMYIHGVVDDQVLDELRRRLDRIDIDGILDSGHVEELIQDTGFSVFPTILNTERPDVTAAALLEGRVAILVDGSPFVLVVPALFMQFFHSPEDFTQRVGFASFVRLLRYFSAAIALLMPALFIAITTFHPNMLPPPLLISLAAQREGVPFPTFIEAMLMEIAFEILREAGLRMPRSIGSAISIVGAMVIGTAAVEAGFISAAIVIIVSITAIASFVTPVYDMGFAIRLMRFGFMVLAAVFGLFGITIGLIALVLHLCGRRSFGVPYLTPMAPFNWSGQKDAIIRLPIWMMRNRPRLISRQNPVRQQPMADAKPKPPGSGNSEGAGENG